MSLNLGEEEAKKAIDGLRNDLRQKKEAGDLFGRENAQGKLKGILGSINQTFGGKDLYPSIEEKAAYQNHDEIRNPNFEEPNKFEYRISKRVYHKEGSLASRTILHRYASLR